MPYIEIPKQNQSPDSITRFRLREESSIIPPFRQTTNQLSLSHFIALLFFPFRLLCLYWSTWRWNLLELIRIKIPTEKETSWLMSGIWSKVYITFLFYLVKQIKFTLLSLDKIILSMMFFQKATMVEHGLVSRFVWNKDHLYLSILWFKYYFINLTV